MTIPLCIDLFSGLGGWTEGFLAAGYECVGFDIERHVYGDHQYPAQLVVQDVLTLHGAQFRDAAVIVASSPCQAYSYMAMPWSRAKQIARALRGEDDFPAKYDGYRTIADLNALFEAPKRIQREAIAAAGHFIPMIQENVRGAIPWVGRSQWNFGSYHLWGDVPALMPIPHKVRKTATGSWDPTRANYQKDHTWANGEDVKVSEATKVPSEDGRRTDVGKGALFTSRDCGDEGKKNVGFGSYAERKARGDALSLTASNSRARKAASAAIAKIPFALASHIAECYYPREGSA